MNEEIVSAQIVSAVRREGPELAREDIAVSLGGSEEGEVTAFQANKVVRELKVSPTPKTHKRDR